MILHRKNSGRDAIKNNCIPYAVKGKGLLYSSYGPNGRMASFEIQMLKLDLQQIVMLKVRWPYWMLIQVGLC